MLTFSVELTEVWEVLQSFMGNPHDCHCYENFEFYILFSFATNIDFYLMYFEAHSIFQVCSITILIFELCVWPLQILILYFPQP